MANKEPVSNGKATKAPTVLTITLEDGVFQYKLDEKDGRRSSLSPGESIDFYCTKPFAIDFKGVTPFMQMSGHPKNHRIHCVVGGHANVGTYYYTIAAYDHGKVYIDDPEVVIPLADPNNTVNTPRPLDENEQADPNDTVKIVRPLHQGQADPKDTVKIVRPLDQGQADPNDTVETRRPLRKKKGKRSSK